MSKSYERIPVGTPVRIKRTWRSPVTVSGPDAFTEWLDHGTDVVGVVVSVTNAGFRGIEHCVDTAEGYAVGIAAPDLEVIQ